MSANSTRRPSHGLGTTSAPFCEVSCAFFVSNSSRSSVENADNNNRHSILFDSKAVGSFAVQIMTTRKRVSISRKVIRKRNRSDTYLPYLKRNGGNRYLERTSGKSLEASTQITFVPVITANTCRF